MEDNKKHMDENKQEVQEKKEEKQKEIGVWDLGISVPEDADVDAIAEKVPPLSSVGFALRNSLKLMDGKYGGGFYVRFVQDNVQKYGWLELLIAYPDDTVKSVLLYKNAFRQTNTDSSGVYRPTEQEKRARKYDDNDDYIGCDFKFAEDYEAPNMPIPSKVIWDRICVNYDQIPIVKISKTSSLETVYLEMAKLAANCAKRKELAFMDTDECFFVATEDFRTIASRNGWRQKDLKIEFDKTGLFIKDKTGGYQKSKKVNEKHLHYYVLKKELPCDEGSVKTLEDTAYQSWGKNPKEKLKEDYEKKLKRLEDEMTAAAIEKRPPRDNIALI